MGVRVAHNIISSNILDVIELMPDYSIIEVVALEEWENKALFELKLPNKMGVSVMAIKTGDKINISPYADDIIKAGDVVVLLGHNDNLRKIEQKNIKD